MDFKYFLESLKTPSTNDKILLGAIINAFSVITESLSTDDANFRATVSISKDVGTSPVINPVIKDSGINEYFAPSLSSDKLEIVKQSQFGLGRVAKYADAGRSIVSNDPMKNQFTGVQYYAGDSSKSSQDGNKN